MFNSQSLATFGSVSEKQNIKELEQRLLKWEVGLLRGLQMISGG